MLAESSWTAWAIEHSAFLRDRYQVQLDGKTAFQKLFGNTYDSKLLEFGQPCMARHPDATESERGKMEARFA